MQAMPATGCEDLASERSRALTIKCDCCGLVIEPTELLICTTAGADFHMECAIHPWIDKGILVDARVLNHPQRLDEYEQARSSAGQAELGGVTMLDVFERGRRLAALRPWDTNTAME